MTLPEQEGRPVWEPVVIVLFLAVLFISDGNEVLALFQHRMPVGGQARAALELGVAVVMLWGLLRAALKTFTWTPGADDAA